MEAAQILSGPLTSSLLGDLGADVVKLEPDGGDSHRRTDRSLNGQSSYYAAANRNKRAITLDITDEASAPMLRELVARADVFITNLRPAAVARYGIDHETLSKVNDRLIYCHITGFGEEGPQADFPSMDLIAQAESGLMAVTGNPGEPPVKSGSPISDFAAAFLAVQGVLAALLKRARTGRGCKISLNLLDASLAVVGNFVPQYFATGREIAPNGNGHPYLVPYQAFLARDQYFVVGCMTQKFWERLCVVIEKPDWITDNRYRTIPDRTANRAELVESLGVVFAEREAGEWVSLLREAGVPAGMVNSLGQAATAPQIAVNGTVAEIHESAFGSYRTVRNPVLYDGRALPIRYAVPSLDDDRAAIFAEWDIGDKPTAIDRPDTTSQGA